MNNYKQITNAESSTNKKLLKTSKTLSKLLIALSIMLTSCTGKKQNNYNDLPTVTAVVEETDTPESIMYENSLNTIKYYDDNLDCNSRLYVRNTIEDLEKLYHESLENNDIEMSNTYLYCIIFLIMECQLTDALNIDTSSNMVYFDINTDKKYLSIITDNISKEKRYYLDCRKLKEAAKYLNILKQKEAQYGTYDEYDIENIYEFAKELAVKKGRITGDIFTKKKIMLTNK